MENKQYRKRLIDDKIDRYLSVFGALSIEGPKWCGKTWTALKHGKTIYYLDLDQTNKLALLDINKVLEGDFPVVIDEWIAVPKIWDAVRRKCDETTESGKYILTCSTKLTTEEFRNIIFHSGAGRIGKVNMYPMSLYESGDSTGKASIMDMYNGIQKSCSNGEADIHHIAYLIVRGGWPQNINNPDDVADLLPNSYIENILNKDINDDKNRDKNKMLMLLKSLARNESSICSNNTLLKDIEENENGNVLENKITLSDYLDVLTRLHLIDNQEAYSENYRSPKRVGKASKRHFVDPSLACAILNITSDKLLNDLNTFGFFFEALVERDLKIYMDSLYGKIYHFRDNVSGLEVDAILEFKNGDYAAVEIKLGINQVDEAINNLLKFSENMLKKPKFMCIIVGNIDSVIRDEKTGIYILPVTALKP